MARLGAVVLCAGVEGGQRRGVVSSAHRQHDSLRELAKIDPTLAQSECEPRWRHPGPSPKRYAEGTQLLVTQFYEIILDPAFYIVSTNPLFDQVNYQIILLPSGLLAEVDSVEIKKYDEGVPSSSLVPIEKTMSLSNLLQ